MVKGLVSLIWGNFIHPTNLGVVIIDKGVLDHQGVEILDAKLLVHNRGEEWRAQMSQDKSSGSEFLHPERLCRPRRRGRLQLREGDPSFENFAGPEYSIETIYL